MLDPEAAGSFAKQGASMLDGLEGAGVWETVLSSEPEPHRTAEDSDLDGVAHAFADMADLQTPFKGHIPMPARLLAAADTYQALTSGRPHRPALEQAAAAVALEQEAAASRLDGPAVSAVLSAAGHARKPRSSWPDGLTDREIEVLRLISRGASLKEVGEALVISPRTAAHHIQHIYDKIGVSTRAAAAMYAMEHELLG